jgi:RHH-type rel operon transcriptional repressor/antitoxin RelB
MSKTLNVRLTDDISSRLDILAIKTKRPKSFHVREILARHLPEYEDAYLALERLSDRNAKYHSTEDLEKIQRLRARQSECLRVFPETVRRDMDGRDAALLREPVEPAKGMR